MYDETGLTKKNWSIGGISLMFVIGAIFLMFVIGAIMFIGNGVAEWIISNNHGGSYHPTLVEIFIDQIKFILSLRIW